MTIGCSRSNVCIGRCLIKDRDFKEQKGASVKVLYNEALVFGIKDNQGVLVMAGVDRF